MLGRVKGCAPPPWGDPGPGLWRGGPTKASGRGASLLQFAASGGPNTGLKASCEPTTSRNATNIVGVMLLFFVFIIALLLMMITAVTWALAATLANRRRQAANDHDTPLITSHYRTQMRWAGTLLGLALALLAFGQFAS